jgi:hypothetical protein
MQQVQRVARLGDDHGHLHAGLPFAQAQHTVRDQGPGGAGHGGHRHRAAHRAAEPVQVGTGSGKNVDNGAGAFGQCTTGSGEGHAARRAVEQRAAGLPLQYRQLLRHCRRGKPEGARGRCDRPAQGNLAQHHQPPRVHHKKNLRHTGGGR